MNGPVAGSRWDAPAQATTIRSKNLIETHLRVAPSRDGGDFAGQARAAYEELGRQLRGIGATPADIVTEKIFLSDLPSQAEPLSAIRRAFHTTSAAQAGVPPAVTLVQQPPAAAGRWCEIQTVVMQPSGNGELARRPLRGLPPGATGMLVTEGDLRHVFLSGVAPGEPTDDDGFQRQAFRLFELAEACLSREEFSFGDVVRTWIYLADVDSDYGYLNLARRDFFTSRRIEPPPASTGIRGVPHPAGSSCGLDLRAIGGGAARPGIRPIRAATMNEAPEYGADFSRGTRVDLPDRAVIHLSGTASVDNDGCVVHPGSSEGQLNRMLLNVEELLAGQGTDPSSIVSAVTYLKHADDLALFREIAARRGFRETFPNTIVVTDICRTGWLCEIEAVAVLGASG